MDAISLAVVVTFLSIGLALVYLFKSDYEGRQKKIINNSHDDNNNNLATRKVNNKKDAKIQVASSKTITQSKQVPLETAAVVQPQPQPPPLPASHNLISTHATTINSNSISNNKHTQQNKIIPYSNAKDSQRSNHIKNKSNSIHNNNNISKRNANNEILQSHLDTLDHSTESSVRGTDPSIDELDTSVILGMLANPLNIKLQGSNKVSKNSAALSQINNNYQTNSNFHDRNKSSNHRNKRHNSDYSAEQLFNIIAACNLSKDEVELAVETLLNKLESGESDWKHPKGDPLQRLKNQLRESESSLLVEIQNHEQTRARVLELRSQIQTEKLSAGHMKEELAKLKQEFKVVSVTLDQTRADLTKQQILNKQLREDSSQVISKLEQEKTHLQNLLASASNKDGELSKCRKEIEDKNGQLQRYELSNQTMAEELQSVEAKLRSNEAQLEQLRSNKQHDDYEFEAKISELESDRMQLEKALKDHAARQKEALEKNRMLEKSIKELQVINNRQEEMLKQARDERHVNESSMKRTLHEMEQELKELHTKLTSNSLSQDEKLRKEISHAEKELSHADKREQKLLSEMNELRAGLSALLPRYMSVSSLQVDGDDWVHSYLSAIKQLAKTVDELKELNNNNCTTTTPTKISVDKSTHTIKTNGASSRVNSPTSNGRASKGEYTYISSNISY